VKFIGFRENRGLSRYFITVRGYLVFVYLEVVNWIFSKEKLQFDSIRGLLINRDDVFIGQHVGKKSFSINVANQS